MPLPFLRSVTFLVIALTFFNCRSANAQQPLRPDTPVLVGWTPQPRIQTLLAMPDTLLVTDSFRMGVRTPFGLSINALIVTRMPGHDTLKGLRLDLSRKEKEDESYLDIEEAAALSQALGAMIETSLKVGRDDRKVTEMTFTTLGNFSVRMRIDGRGPRVEMQSGTGNPIVSGIETTDLPSVKSLIDDAIAFLSTK